MSDAPTASSPGTRRRMQAMSRGRDTQAELRIRRALWRRGCRGYRVDRDLTLPGLRRRGDLVWVARRIVVFIDGCFWHGCPEHGTSPRSNSAYWGGKLAANTRRDRQTDQLAQEHGWTVIRIWEHEDPDEVATRIKLALEQINSPSGQE